MWIGVALGGALGALARYGLTLLLEGLSRGSSLSGFPLATLIINVLGSFLLALVVTLTLEGSVPEAWRVWIGTGFLGAFTTFSTFTLEADGLLSRGQTGLAALYVLGTLIPGFLAVLAGRALGLALVR